MTVTEKSGSPKNGSQGNSRSNVDTLEQTLWKAADKLRGSMDAAEYKHFVLGLVFLRYVSDAFRERREQLERDLAAEDITGETARQFLDDPDEYTGHRVFWVPEDARWETLIAKAGQVASSEEDEDGERRKKALGMLLNDAMDSIERANDSLRGALPKSFNRINVDTRRLKGLLDLIGKNTWTSDNGSARDVLGEAYEYLLDRFAKEEGKRGGEFYTPKSVVQLLVEVLEPRAGQRVYDPCCGSGGMFVQAEKFIESHGGNPLDISVLGQELNQNTWQLARMNTAIHGLGADLGRIYADTFHEDQHPEAKVDVVLANPPFNISDWGGEDLGNDHRWAFGVPPKGNANFAWLQHIVDKLSARGSAGVVLANGSMASKQSGEGEIRKSMVEDDAVACMIALPPQLFRTTGIPACLWFLTKDKTPQGSRRLHDRRGETLFIDARNMGRLVTRAERVLDIEEIERIAGVYRRWRGTDRSAEYVDEPGFCYSAETEEIREHGHVLTPGRYVGAAATEEDDEPIQDKIDRLTEDLFTHFDESARLETIVREQLGRI